MNPTSTSLALLIGLASRLAIPILVTALAVWALGKLDKGWQAEAEQAPLKVEKPKCWKAQGCAPAARKACPGYKSALPCWQVFRLPSGYLDEKCLACPVLVKAPLPAGA